MDARKLDSHSVDTGSDFVVRSCALICSSIVDMMNEAGTATGCFLAFADVDVKSFV